MFSSRTLKAIVAFRRLPDEQIESVYEIVAGYVSDMESDGMDVPGGAALLELIDALVEEGLIEPTGQDT